MKDSKWEKKWAEIIAKAWADENFKKQLLEHPNKVLKENGIDLPDFSFTVLENKGKKRYLVLPEKPEKNLSKHELNRISAGGIFDSNPCIP